MADKARVQLLVDALLSGRFEQHTGSLGQGGTNRRCCLGVACEVAAENGCDVRILFESDTKYAVDGESFTLPRIVSEWYGFESWEFDDPFIKIDSAKPRSAAVLNDTTHSFEKIAELFKRRFIDEEIVITEEMVFGRGEDDNTDTGTQPQSEG